MQHPDRLLPTIGPRCPIAYAFHIARVMDRTSPESATGGVCHSIWRNAAHATIASIVGGV